MDDEKIKGQIGANIAERRKAAGMTQAGLAEKINYSDKAKTKKALAPGREIARCGGDGGLYAAARRRLIRPLRGHLSPCGSVGPRV